LTPARHAGPLRCACSVPCQLLLDGLRLRVLPGRRIQQRRQQQQRAVQLRHWRPSGGGQRMRCVRASRPNSSYRRWRSGLARSAEQAAGGWQPACLQFDMLALCTAPAVCPANTYFMDGACQSCPDGASSSEGSTSSAQCSCDIGGQEVVDDTCGAWTPAGQIAASAAAVLARSAEQAADGWQPA
jgi:hypothetical protein